MKTLLFTTFVLTIGFLPTAIPSAQANTPSTTTQLEILALDRDRYPAITIDGGFDSQSNYTLAKLADRDLAKFRSDRSNLIANNNRDRSVEYQQIGMEAQKKGDRQTALENYYAAVKLDPENGHAWLLVGMLVSDKQLGIDCVKTAARLFKAQEDRDCYQIAINWLQKVGASD